MIGIFAGSFNPITLGHDYIIQEASKLVDTLYVVVAENSDKTYMFNVVDRVKMAKIATGRYGNVLVLSTNKLVIDLAKEVGATVLFRGLRYASEYEYELNLALWNSEIGSIPTVGIFPKDLAISSSAIRLLIKYENPQWRKYVHPGVAKHIDFISL